MDKTSELLMRSTLHDMANVLAGVKGILELNQPGQPINQRDRQRLEAVLEEGIATLDRCRHLAMETLPDRLLESGATWRSELLEQLEPMGTLFRSQFVLDYAGPDDLDQWPGRLLLGYARAVTRQVLPYAKGGTMVINCSADPAGWRLQWTPVPVLPEALGTVPEDRAMDICGRWAVRAGSALGVSLSCEGGSLLVRIPR